MNLSESYYETFNIINYISAYIMQALLLYTNVIVNFKLEIVKKSNKSTILIKLKFSQQQIENFLNSVLTKTSNAFCYNFRLASEPTSGFLLFYATFQRTLFAVVVQKRNFFELI